MHGAGLDVYHSYKKNTPRPMLYVNKMNQTLFVVLLRQTDLEIVPLGQRRAIGERINVIVIP